MNQEELFNAENFPGLCSTFAELPEARQFYSLALQNPEALQSNCTQQIRQLLFSSAFPVKVHSKCFIADVLIGLIHSLEVACHSQNIFQLFICQRCHQMYSSRHILKRHFSCKDCRLLVSSKLVLSEFQWETLMGPK